ncbi:hypothetical protein UFOVP1247_148 [uncultured Caudovirales phage]|jgi:hypothetical protein|uniref:Uncharacterized protein n=1 Tax=uncultured Caudovirales phage TaxID=2100421 RepID=A0A6J5Q1G6_9CAUD|nr:hypothetical protein UFOVP970_188 [uncultured Caudovirales phage]CAB4193772.1 hypothetical protein UFOVP1247_148 [uncultured Caudovirales phage]
MNWTEIPSTSQCFQLEDEPELIHVIKTGFRDMYMVVHEDAYEYSIGKVEFGTREDIEVRYKITIN